MDLSGIPHHPLFQSVVLPVLLSLIGIGVLRAVSGRDRAAAAIGLAVLAATIWLMGWQTPPTAVMQRLPWIFAGAWLVGIALDAAVASRFLRWSCLGLAWIAASWWLGSSGIIAGMVLAIAGLVVIACLLRAPPERAEGAAAAVIAALGLAALAFIAGSLALFQLALLLAAALGGAGLWLWPVARIRFGAAAVAVAAIGWLAIAQAALLLIPVRPSALALLAVAFAAAPLLARPGRQGNPLLGPVGVAVVAAVLAGGSLALQSAGTAAGDAANGDGGGGDAYYGTQGK